MHWFSCWWSCQCIDYSDYDEWKAQLLLPESFISSTILSYTRWTTPPYVPYNPMTVVLADEFLKKTKKTETKRPPFFVSLAGAFYSRQLVFGTCLHLYLSPSMSFSLSQVKGRNRRWKVGNKQEVSSSDQVAGRYCTQVRLRHQVSLAKPFQRRSIFFVWICCWFL